jgi:hypothetical protein
LIVYIIMAPKKVTKGVPKRGEKVNPTDPHPKIVVEMVNSPELPVEEVPFDAIDSPQQAATTAAQHDDDDDDDDVPANSFHLRSTLARKQGQLGVVREQRA